MKVDNKIYFAPGIEFRSVDWDDHHSLVENFRARVYAYYITPAQRMSEWISNEEYDPSIMLGIAFGSGVICCTTIDFLARTEFTEFRRDEVVSRYTKWLKKYISEMIDPNPANNQQTKAYRFYDEFRNGLIHEGRVKNAGQFSLDPATFDTSSQIFTFVDNAMVVHPFNLLSAIEAGLRQFCDNLHSDPNKLADFWLNLRTLFNTDINYSLSA